MFYQSRTKQVAALLVCILFAGLAWLPQISTAATIQYDFDHEFSSGTPPSGPAPWLRAVFTDVAPGTVQLTLSTVNLTGSEFVSGWYFNLNPAFSTSDLVIASTGSAGAFADPAVYRGTDAFKADGDGKYDLLFSFATGGDDTQRFTSGDSLVLTFSGINGLTADDFNFMSAPAGGHGPYVAAAHVQSIATGYSGWVDPSTTIPGGDVLVPESSSTLLLLGLSFLAFATIRRRLQPS